MTIGYDERKNQKNIRKHKISIPELATIFENPFAPPEKDIPDVKHSNREKRELIDLFQKFVALTEVAEFQDYDVREMRKMHRNKNADVYKELLHRCYVPNVKTEMTKEKVFLREQLEK